MEDMRQLQNMGCMDESMVDEMQGTIDKAKAGEEMKAAFKRINELQKHVDNSPVPVKHVPKHEKSPLGKNTVKRRRKLSL